MVKAVQNGDIWTFCPYKPIALIELIGGSYLATNPQITYRRLIQKLNEQNFAVSTWSYTPGFDHQIQANIAWKNFRVSKKQLENKIGSFLPTLRIGHSLGCKLHLLAPDGGRNSKTFIALCFNNFPAARSVPMLGKISSKIRAFNEFNPSPTETLRLILKRYSQPHNLLVKFGDDKLDQSHLLLDCLKSRSVDKSKCLHLQGNHLTPASAGLRKNILGTWADDPMRIRNIDHLVKVVSNWSRSFYPRS